MASRGTFPWMRRIAVAYGAARMPRRAVHVAGFAAAAGVVGATALSPVHLDAPRPIAAPRTVQDPATSQALPAAMTVDCDGVPSTLRLVGLGVRTVTFLRMQVYVAGVYVDERAVSEPHAAPAAELEPLFAQWLERGVPCAVRIMPVRGTDFGHLRDGLVRAVNVRAREARKAGSAYALTDVAEARLADNIGALKQLFPRGSVPKGHLLDLVVWRAAGGAYTLALAYDEQRLGTVVCGAEDARAFAMPMHLLLAYVGARPDISAPLRASIAHGLHEGLP